MAFTQHLLKEDTKVKNVLNSLMKNEEIQSVALISTDGTIRHEFLPEIVNKEQLGTMVATLLGSAGIIIRQLNNEDVEKVVINSPNGKVIVLLFDNSLLTVIISKDADIIRIMKEIDEATKNIKERDCGIQTS